MHRYLRHTFAAGRRLEDVAVFICLAAVALFPSLEVVARFFETGIHSSTDYVQHLVIWITFLGGMIASRENNHLGLTVALEYVPKPARTRIETATHLLAAGVSTVLAWSAYSFVDLAFLPGMKVGIFPQRWVMTILPIGFGIIALRFVLHTPGKTGNRLIASAGIPLAILLALAFKNNPEYLVWPGAILLIASAVFGTPVFVVLGGLAAVLFFASEGTTVVIPNEAYTMLTGPAIPAIPLFTLAGFILSESKAGERLVRLFRALFGFLPGGLAIMTILICTFFTSLTGASGVTILAVGGVLSYILMKHGYSKGFTTGLLTVNGIGSIFPPSLPVIMYGVIAQVNIKHLFVAGLLPGSVMVLALAAVAFLVALRSGIPHTPFEWKEARGALRGAFWEILIPVVILASFLGGLTTLVETAAVTVLYVLIIEVVIRRDLKFRDLPGTFLKSVPIMGGVLIILSVAKGFSYYIVDQQVPMALAEWMQSAVGSKYVFLILLNIALLVTGCFMDVFSAIVVVVPLILPLAESYGIHPVHLGVIFLANLEVGYLTPPVGINLFLASYRFGVPLSKVYRHVMPFVAIMLGSVLVITYLPFISLFLVRLLW
jgi:tripartite ATP-independent transporter DctM subunit